MSNMPNNVMKHNQQKYPNQAHGISRVNHQSMNPRGSAPTENHSRPDQRHTYSSAARQGIPQHDMAKAHQSGVITSQSNLSAQVPNVNAAAPQMPASAVPNAAPNQMHLQQTVSQMMPQPNRFNHPFHPQQQRPQQQQRQALLNHRPNNGVPNSVPQNAVQQSVGHNMGPHQPNHQQYFTVMAPQQHHIPQMTYNLAPHNMAHSFQQRAINPTNMHYYMYAHPQQQQQQPQQAFQPQPAYPYGMNVYSSHFNPQPATHPNAQMVSSQLQPRGQPVAAQPVIQTTHQPLPVQMTAPTPEMNTESPTPVSTKVPKRTRTLAILTDPNSGKTIDLADLAKNPIEEANSQTDATLKTESHPGTSNPPNTTQTSKEENAQSIALNFATAVVVAATTTTPDKPSAASLSTTPNVNETVSANSKPQREEKTAISKANTSEPINDKLRDNCDHLTNDKPVIINTNTTISASNTNIDDKTDSKLLNDISAQNSTKINSQLSGEKDVKDRSEMKSEISENGDLTDSCNDLSEQKTANKPDIAKDYSIQQKVNNNNNINDQKKEPTVTENRKLEDSVSVSNDLEVTDNVVRVTVVDKIDPKPKSERSSPVMIPTLDNECTDNSTKTDVICNNNICEIDLQIKTNEINRLNEIKSNDECLEKIEIQVESAIPTPKTALPDLPYKDDQWTPLNPEGKKHYERDFLYAVRDKSSSLKMPEILQKEGNREIIRKESSGGHTEDAPLNFFMPTYVKSNSRIGTVPGRRVSTGRQPETKNRKIISTSLTQEVKLHTTENAWKPLAKQFKDVADPDEQETLELLKKIRGILNKLTPQKYDDLSKQILSFKIDTEDRLKRVLDLVFEKAVDEPAFCLQYANLCKHLSKFKVMVNKEENAEEVKFLKLLLHKCQKEFEADIYASITDLKEREEEIEKCTDPQQKKFKREVLDEDMRRARKRSLGNIKLIGELYKLNLLKANIMVQCIDNLIKDADDESLECLCALLRTIGGQIEKEASSNSQQTMLLDAFFVKMQNVADHKDPKVKGTSARVRFMLRDINDMRRNGWKARRDENLPKMIDEIHSDAQKEDEQMIRDRHQHSSKKQQEERDHNKKGGRQGNESGEGGAQWTTVIGRKSQNASQPNIDWQKMRNMQQQNHDTVQLGPQSGSAWAMGSRGGGGGAGGGASSSQSRFAAEDKQLNRFSPLEGNDSRKSSQKIISSRDSSKGRSNQQNYGQQGRGGRSQGGGGGRGVEREDAINLARSFSSRQSPSESSPSYPNMISRNSSRSDSREASAPNSRNSSIRRETPDIEVNQLRGSQSISAEDLEEKCKVSLKEYLNVKNVDEPVLDVCNLCNDSNADVYILSAINCALDNSSQSDHFLIGKLIIHLISKQCLKLDHFYKGLNSILEYSGDVELDVPKMWDYIGNVIAPIFVNLTANRKTFLLEVVKRCDRNRSSKFIAKILKAVSIFTTETKANELWFSCGVNWTDFLDSNQNIEDFVTQHNVEFTTKTPTNKSNNSEQKLSHFVEDIETLVKQKKSNDEIQNFISKHFNVSQTNNAVFTSALFRAIIQGCISAHQDIGETTLDEPTLIAIAPLLQKFLGGEPDGELQALIVLQELMERLQHPPNLLLKIFQCLYDHSVISHDGFLQWEKCDGNGSGKAVAVKSVVRFLTWLRENEDDEEENEPITS